MEKKNNQMVDKEKELKNVAPDTDVAPDVTDASSFQGGPSHTSSNRQQMRLINKIRGTVLFCRSAQSGRAE